MKMVLGRVLFLTLIGYLYVNLASGQQDSICHTRAYRSLPTELQNEHQCMVLEKLQEDIRQEGTNQAEQLENLHRMINSLHVKMKRGFQSVARSSRGDQARSKPSLSDVPVVRDCQELYQSGITISGVYPIRLPSRRLINVWCDMNTSYGGWTVIQRRIDGTVNFTRPWNQYAFGFGNVNTEYWLGNEHLTRLTTIQNYAIRIDLWDWEDNHAFALYDNFKVDHEHTVYQLHIQGYSGTAGDAMGPYHNEMRFSTIDSDNDQWHASCAQMDQSGWWFRACGYASLNGLYIKNGNAEMTPDGLIKGIIWYAWKNDSTYSLKKTEMKIKPLTSILFEREQELLKATTTTSTTTPQPTTTTTTTQMPTTTTTQMPTTTTPMPTTPTTSALEKSSKDDPENNAEGQDESLVNLNKKFERFKILEKDDKVTTSMTVPVSIATQIPLTTDMAKDPVSMTTTINEIADDNR